MSNTLLPCPFCGGEALMRERYINGIANTKHYIRECHHCKATFAHWFRSVKKADAAWNRRVRLENKPLTLDELRQMDGEPVWCVDKKDKGKWALVHAREEMCVDADYGDWEFYSYGWLDSDVGWVAYRNKPKDGAE